MDKIKKILAPTDFSELSKAGVRYAFNLAKELGAEVIVYHAVNRDELLEYGHEIKAERSAVYPYLPGNLLLEKYELALVRFLKENFSDLLPSVDVREKVELGRPESNIVEEAKKEGVDLIVISTHGRTGLSHMLMGSVTEKVVRHASCPVLSIHPEREEEETPEVKAVA
ncbi:MAG: universal stress protein [Candidatus Binatia bacterium]